MADSGTATQPPAARCFDVAVLMEQLSLCAANPSNQQRGDLLRALVARFTDAPTNEAANSLAALMATCRMHLHDAGMQRNAFQALFTAVENDRSLAAIAPRAGAFEALTAAMHAHPADAEVQTQCCAMLMALCAFHEDKEPRALNAGALDAAVAALETFSADATIAQSVVVALCELIKANADNAVHVTAAGAAPLLMAVMQKHIHNADIMRDVLALVRRMTVSFSPCRVQLLRAGALTAVLDVVEAHCVTSSVARMGAKALERLFSHDRVAHCVPATTMSRVVAFTVALLTQRHDCIETQVAACDVLLHVLECDVTEPASFAVHIGAVPSIIAALQAHRGDVTMQTRGCLVLCKLLINYIEGTEALALDAVSAMMTALRMHAAHVGVQRDVLATLGAIAKSSLAALAAAAEFGAVEVIVAALRIHSVDAKVQYSAFAALRWMLSDNACARRARAVEDVMRLLATVVRSCLDLDAVKFALRCVFELVCNHPQELERAVHDGVLEACEQARTNIFSAGGADAASHELMTTLRAAAARHDAARCTYATCVRCAGARSRCELCALPGCGLRRCDDNDHKALMRCLRLPRRHVLRAGAPEGGLAAPQGGVPRRCKRCIGDAMNVPPRCRKRPRAGPRAKQPG